MSIGRREFLAGLGGFGAGLGLGSVSHWFPLASPEVGADWAPGRERFVTSTCLLCPSHCGIRGRLIDDTLVRVDGNPLHPVSRGGLCPKGRAGIQLLYHPARLTGPVERVGPRGTDQFSPISWDDALARVAARLGELRDGGETRSVAWLTGHVPGVMGELLRRFASRYGGARVLRDHYADGSAEVLRMSQGIGAPPAFDLAGSDLVVSFGAPLSEAWWCLSQAARARDAGAGRRPRWVQVDARHSRTAARADEWVPVRPGTYGTLALGLAYVILKEGLYDAEWVRKRVHGLEDWTDESGNTVPGFRTLVLRHGRTATVAERTGLTAETVVRLAKAIGAARRPVAVWDQVVSWRSGGLADALAIHALNVLTGALGRPGGVLVQPEIPVPALDGEEDPAAVPDPHWATRRNGGDEPPIQVLFLYQTNPLASAADAGGVREALERIPLVISFSPFLDESARHADLVLPDHTYLERWQDAPAPPSVPIAVWGIVQPLVEPLLDTRATGDVVLDLAARLGGDVAEAFPWSNMQQIVEERGRALAAAHRGGLMDRALRREELRELEARGWWVPHGQSADAFWSSLRERGGWYDPYYDYHDRSAESQFADGRVRVFPADARQRIASTVPDLAAGFLPLATTAAAEADDAAYPLRLLPFRVMTLSSGGTALMPWLLENLGVMTGDAWEVWAEINPVTGRGLGLTSGQAVRIESEAGGFVARLRFYPGAQPGVVNVPYGLHTSVGGWGRARGANPLHAVGVRQDPSTGLPDWYSTRVRVVAV